LDLVVYNKQGEFDVFAELKKRIADVDAQHKDVEIRLEADVDKVMKKFGEFTFKFDQNEKVFRNLVSSFIFIILTLFLYNSPTIRNKQ